MKLRLAVVSSHPIQYQAPLFKRLAKRPELDLTVYFCRDFGVGGEQYDPGFDRKFKWDIPLLEGYVYKFLPNRSPRPSSSFFGLINPSIIRELRGNSYDAVWVHGYATMTNWLAFAGAWMTKTPVMLRGESHLLNQRAGWRRLIKRLVLPPLFANIASFLPIGSLNRDYYRHYGVPIDKMVEVPYAVDNEFFQGKYKGMEKERERLRSELGVGPDRTVILFASKMLPRKGAMDLLRAYEKVREGEGEGAALVFVGDGGERNALESYAKGHGVKDALFTGFKNQTELPGYFTAADVFVLPSTEEPWGLIINEAMNLRLPVVTTDKVGAGPDLVKDGENGFIYPAGDVEALSAALKRLVRDPALRQKMGEASLRIIDRWSFNEDVEGILAALERIKGCPGGAGQTTGAEDKAEHKNG
jgi:glycosyltransferase involved in cell wall biosynthesis